MDDLWVRNDRPIPASYWVAASLGSLVVLVCYATAVWVPWFLRDFGSSLAPSLYAYVPGLLTVAGTGLGVLPAAAPWLALRWPSLAIALSALPAVLTPIGGAPVHFGVFASLCAVTVTAGWRSATAAVASAGVAALVVIAWIATRRDLAAPFRARIQIDYYSGGRLVALALVYLAVIAAVLAVAYLLRRSAERELERRALASRSGQVEQQAAVVGERARLARDLHDVVAHHVSLIAVRAETAPYTHPGLGDEARGVLGDIAADARLALDELRGVLGILGRSGEAERAPQPTWSDIPALVERTRSAGAEIEVVGDAAAEVGPAAGYAAYRVVQEALTNARKHAPGARVTVDLETTSQLLTVLVSTPLVADAPSPGPGGRGLVGMRERVEALGGRLLTGPVGDDFVVEAILPRGLAAGAA